LNENSVQKDENGSKNRITESSIDEFGTVNIIPGQHEILVEDNFYEEKFDNEQGLVLSNEMNNQLLDEDLE
jgi:hypothetical protein